MAAAAGTPGCFVLVPALSRDRSKLRDVERSRLSEQRSAKPAKTGVNALMSHSASKTRANALMALHRIRHTGVRDGKLASDAL
jgi:hypothetical protein